ncbi:hypothetical protein HY3_06440 [Hyphomonas pacifica]|uniref:Major intrinsic protein n=2 Tax=Hyphomonas pacifica TaxID=1280941 RepID=A0A062TV89_9PROT|nr:hypothetical protein HY2_05465 [Hyphomonas pacifica]RAN30450.1 hypothetical protein HY3_06440 [Hyphomonas pacifica]RAN31837.1 hypothetical protein HY11_06535 [Hyphomonas pacifica]
MFKNIFVTRPFALHASERRGRILHGRAYKEARHQIDAGASLEPPLLMFSILRRLVAEALLLAIIIGSGIMGDRLSTGNRAIALLGNTLAIGAGLYVLITMFGLVSGAHFNPAVTLAFYLQREISWPLLALTYLDVQGRVA